MSGDQPAGWPSRCGRRAPEHLGAGPGRGRRRAAPGRSGRARRCGAGDELAQRLPGALPQARRSGLASRQAAVSVARDGLESLHRRMRVIGRDGEETGLDTLLSAPAPASWPRSRCRARGGRARAVGPVPRRAAARRRAAAQAGGVGGRRRHRAVLRGRGPDGRGASRLAGPARPDGRGARGRRRSGPAAGAAELGARVIGVDLPRPAIWERVLAQARRSAGTLIVPVPRPGRATRTSRSGPGWT